MTSTSASYYFDPLGGTASGFSSTTTSPVSSGPLPLPLANGHGHAGGSTPHLSFDSLSPNPLNSTSGGAFFSSNQALADLERRHDPPAASASAPAPHHLAHANYDFAPSALPPPIDLSPAESLSPSSTTSAQQRPRKKKRTGSIPGGEAPAPAQAGFASYGLMDQPGELSDDGDDSQMSEDGAAQGGEDVKPAVKRARSTTAGPTSAPKKAKAKRTLEDPEDESSEFEGVKGKKGKGKKGSGDKKKKAGRACGACQKAHLTCDDARPCARCVKKGCSDQCQDGARKKAKYLQEIPDELLERRPPTVAATVEDDDPNPVDEPDDSPSNNGFDTMMQVETSQPFSFDAMPYYDNNSFANEFGSEAANLEYAILSNMLNNNGFQLDAASYGLPNDDPRLNGGGNGASTMLGMGSPLPGDTLGLQGMDRVPVASTSASVGSGGAGSNALANYTSGLFDSKRPGGADSTATSPVQGPISYGGNVMSPPRLQDTARNLFPATLKPDLSSLRSTSEVSAHADHNGGASGSGANNAGESTSGLESQATKIMTAEEVYRSVTKPYPYAQSYHYLVRHLKKRFEKNDILRIIRALATFRPSLIALQMPLTEEDEVFVERTFQRTLVELNKLISFSGTPTVVWRRTGEICLVGNEFCLLTGWSRDELIGKKYIFELFDTSSVVEYYESFAKHAFESTSSSIMTQCVILGPGGRPVPCAFCFSVRRDLFSCPFIVVGSFLPIM
ncbi:hypothetical protein RQP46_006875 [Phenoliferia psychrophenolica]